MHRRQLSDALDDLDPTRPARLAASTVDDYARALTAVGVPEEQALATAALLVAMGQYPEPDTAPIGQLVDPIGSTRQAARGARQAFGSAPQAVCRRIPPHARRVRNTGHKAGAAPATVPTLCPLGSPLRQPSAHR